MQEEKSQNQSQIDNTSIEDETYGFLNKKQIFKKKYRRVPPTRRLNWKWIYRRIAFIAINAEKDSVKLQALQLMGKVVGMFVDVSVVKSLNVNIDKTPDLTAEVIRKKLEDANKKLNEIANYQPTVDLQLKNLRSNLNNNLLPEAESKPGDNGRDKE